MPRPADASAASFVARWHAGERASVKFRYESVTHASRASGVTVVYDAPMADRMDFSPYVRMPRLYARAAIVVVHRTLRAAPTDPSPEVRKALKQLRSTTEVLKAEQKTRMKVLPQSIRPVDRAFDLGWTGVRDRLGAWLKLGDEHAKDRTEAEALLASFFADGVTFVQLPYEEEWVESQSRLERIADEGLRARFVYFCGEPFIGNVELQHKRLGDALDLTGVKAPAKANTRGLSDALTAVTNALGTYIRKLVGEVNEDSEESVEAFKAYVAPLDEYRAGTSIGAQKDDAKEEEDLDGDLPDVPGDDAGDEDTRDPAPGGGGDTPADGDDATKPAIKPGLRGADPFKS